MAVATAVPRGNVDCKTVREILPPWHVLQDKLQKGNAAALAAATNAPDADQAAREALAAQEAANELWSPARAARSSRPGEDAPLSGVRLSEPPQQVAVRLSSPDHGNPPDSLLSFKVYTLAELERRSDAPVSMRSSLANFDTTASRGGPSLWTHVSRVGTALNGFMTEALAWYRAKERPSIKVGLRQPFDHLGDELQRAVESVDWKKLGVNTGIVVGATLTLLFAVLTAAELTDDLKPPGSAAHLASNEVSAKPATDARGVAPATNMAAMGVQPVATPNAIMAPAGIAAPTAPVTAMGDLDPAPSDEVAPAPAKKPAKKAKPKTNKLTFRNPDAVFHP